MGSMGKLSTPKTAHKATRKFHAIWCLSHSVLWSSWINHQWMMNHHPLSFPPWLPCRNCFPLVLVERWRTEAFSRWGYTPPCPTKKGHTQAYSVVVLALSLILPWITLVSVCRSTRTVVVAQIIFIMDDSATGIAPVAHHERHGPLTAYVPRVKRHCCL